MYIYVYMYVCVYVCIVINNTTVRYLNSDLKYCLKKTFFKLVARVSKTTEDVDLVKHQTINLLVLKIHF